MILRPSERPLLVRLLEQASQQASSAGCNDFMLPDTPHNRNIVAAAAYEFVGEDARDIGLSIINGEILANDEWLLEYFIKRLKGEVK